mgnify:CR=1 FL=1
MKTVTIHDAKTNLSKYIAAAKKGEKIYIGGFGKAEVVLTKIEQPTGKRDFSSLKGKIVDLGDAFSEETDKEIADLMLNGPI